MDPGERRRQKNFRCLLHALSRPGRIERLEALQHASQFAAAAALAECLLDAEVCFCVSGNGGIQGLQTVLTSATGARTAPLEAADFVFFAGAASHGGVRRAKRGSCESPEEGATLVYCLGSQALGGSERFRVRLSGPGIPGSVGVAPEMRGIPVKEFQELAAVNADYPLGVDAFFLRPSGAVMGLPRSTRIQVR